MPDRAIVTVVRTAVAVGAVLSLGGSAVLIAAGHVGFWLRQYVVVNTTASICLGAFAWVIVARQPRNPVVWTMAMSAACGLYVTAHAAIDVRLAGPPDDVFARVPSELPTSLAWTLVFTMVTWIPAFFPLLTFGLLLFPDGRLPSPRWRPVAVVAGGAIAVATVAGAASYHPSASTAPEEGTLFTGALIVLLASTILCTVALAQRYRRSQGTTRDQIKWVFWGATILSATVLVSVMRDDSGELWVVVAVLIGVCVFAASYGVAVGRYHLHDVDVVISKTIVYAVLAGSITAIYATVVVGLGSLVGRSSSWLAISGTAVVAVTFEPLRARVQRWANRRVYGKRATPYEVLSEITGGLASTESPSDLLEKMASLLAGATGAARTAVWLHDGDGFTVLASTPPAVPGSSDSVDALPGAVVPVEHGGEVLGALTVEKAPDEVMTAADDALLGDLAGSVALVLRTLRLDADLRATAAELDRSRRRLVTVQDRERRNLEAKLRGSVQRTVDDLVTDLASVRETAISEGMVQVATLVDQLAGETTAVSGQVRALARGLVPPALEAGGLGSAIADLAQRMPLSVEVRLGVDGRHALEFETAVYFCVAEALTNAAKHARPPLSVEVDDAQGHLRFAVTDSGPGFEIQHVTAGAGLRNMADRFDTFGGSVTVVSAPGAPTTVSGALPLTQDMPSQALTS